MNSHDHENPGSQLANIVTVGKDFVSLLRDGVVLTLALLLVFSLVFYPKELNSILVDAGFKKANILGIEWESNLIDSDNALQKAEATIVALRDKNEELLGAIKKAKKDINNPLLTKRLSELETEVQDINKESKQVQIAVTQTIDSNVVLLEKVRSSITQKASKEKSDYVVGLQTLGVLNSDRIAINEKLSLDGYSLDSVTYSYPAGERPSWFAYKSTVFYYSSTSRQAAQDLADFMKAITGYEFSVQRGAGLGVDPERKATTFFIHYIKN